MPDVGGLSQAESVGMTSNADITIRHANARDDDAIARLAALDETRRPTGLVVVAEADGELWAAISADDGHVAADPFRPSADSARLLRDHVGAHDTPRRPGSIRRWLRGGMSRTQGYRAA
jgi:hypothetical protein